jgi:hypothetical protein
LPNALLAGIIQISNKSQIGLFDIYAREFSQAWTVGRIRVPPPTIQGIPCPFAKLPSRKKWAFSMLKIQRFQSLIFANYVQNCDLRYTVVLEHHALWKYVSREWKLSEVKVNICSY